MNTQVKIRQVTIGLTLLATLMLASCGNKAEESAINKPDSSSNASPDAKTSPNQKKEPGTKAAPNSTTELGVKPTGATTCPTDAPVKGNKTKKRGNIYHLPKKSPDYDKIKPEVCFKDQATAEKAGFRAPK